MITSYYPYSLESIRSLNLDPDECTSLELKSSETAYFSICKYLVNICGCKKSARISSTNATDPDDEEKSRGCTFSLGLGTFTINHEGESIHFIHAYHGKPVMGPTYFTTLVLLMKGTTKLDVLKSFVDKVHAWDNQVTNTSFTVYAFNTQNQCWNRSIVKRKRTIESVILPADLKQQLLDDVDNFLGKETARWYMTHCIPYKRSYLLYGPPGTGKTSTITALASYTDRNVAYLHVSDPKMTDAILKKSLQSVPSKSIVVLEDVDALFGADRTKLENIPLSFSGLLNALDGIGGKDASIFVLTTNHIDRLDPALIRPGRVDMQIEYPPVITDEQIEQMFKQFYPQAEAGLSATFLDRVIQVRNNFKHMSTAALQQYFIVHRTSSAKDAVEWVLGASTETNTPKNRKKPDLASVMQK
jgi:chaperone BCS1